MTADAYQDVLRRAHGVRNMARLLAAAGGLDDAIEHAAAAGPSSEELGRGAQMVDDEVALRTVRMLARLGADESLAGEGIASEPPSVGCRLEAPANGSLRGADAPSPAETVAFFWDLRTRRMGPAAS